LKKLGIGKFVMGRGEKKKIEERRHLLAIPIFNVGKAERFEPPFNIKTATSKNLFQKIR
jgi:hypothetical protein